ncbi:MAG TPA: nucleotide-binding domain containing protein, partial [Rhodopila sp.]|nr:nucleotide-binding domain containing protein [Rhodopila sp.]
ASSAQRRASSREVRPTSARSATARADAAAHIASHIDHLTRALPPPATLIAAGGETLRQICQSLGATSLETQGRLLPGLPLSILRGGPWNGVTVVSKSGAFGHPALLRDLLTDERNPS